MNTEQLMKKAMPHLIAIVAMVVITLAYFSPVMSGKVLQQHDIKQWQGMSKEIRDYRADTGKEPLWTNAMFGGMPAYQVSMDTPSNLVNKVRFVLLKTLPKPANLLFVTLLGAYLLMIVLGINPWLGLIGALAYGLSTYNLLIIEAGHVTKMYCLAFMPAIVAGVLLTYKGHLLKGAALAGLALAFQIGSNHYQITYYTMLMLLVFVIVYGIDAAKKNALPYFIKASVVLGLVFITALFTDISRLLTTYEYAPYTIRGASELEGANKGGDGLDKDYALQWSYGKLETMSLLVPRFMGGASSEPISKSSDNYKTFKRYGLRDAVPTYWGAQPFVGGPIYHGAIVCFLFLLGVFWVKGPLKWWLLSVTIMAIVLSWGKNFSLVTNLFFDYFPMYNKFRVPAMILVIAQLAMPTLGIYALFQILNDKPQKDKIKQALLYSGGILGGLLLLFIVLGGGILDFSSLNDNRYPEEFASLLEKERASMVFWDSLRSLVLIGLAAGVIWLFAINKVKAITATFIIGTLLVGDLLQVDTRYLNSKDFTRATKEAASFPLSQADKQILQDKDPNFRVFNTTLSPFQDASTSYHHKSIGGYHGAKLRRYQDLYDYHISKNNVQVLNMLNTKYVITKAGETPVAQRNPDALGNAWFVQNIEQVPDATAEIAALKSFDPAKKAIVDARFNDYTSGIAANSDSSATITLDTYQPNYLKYTANNQTEALAVFSEIYYPKGWNAYIDGTLSEHIRANYVLRALKIPAGNHSIEFKFEPQSFYMGSIIMLISSLLILALVVAALITWGKELLANNALGNNL